MDGEQEIMQIFTSISSDGQIVNTQKLVSELKTMGIDIENGKLSVALKKFEKNGFIAMKDFFEFMKLAQATKKQHDQLKLVFNKIDTNKNNQIEKSEMKAMMIKLGHNYDEQQLNDMFDLIDTDGNGIIDFEEFTNYYKTMM